MMKYYKKQIAPVLDGFAAKAGNTLFLVVIVSGSVFLNFTAAAAVPLPGKGEGGATVAAKPVFGKEAGFVCLPEEKVFGKEADSCGGKAVTPVPCGEAEWTAADGQRSVGKADSWPDVNGTSSGFVGKACSGKVRQSPVFSAETGSWIGKPGIVPVRLATAGKAGEGVNGDGIRNSVSAAGKAVETGVAESRDAAAAGKAAKDAVAADRSLAEAGKADVTAADAPGQSGNVSAGVRVSLKGFDAELMKEIARLREEKARLQEEVQELELARRSLSAENDGLRRELIEALQIIAGQNEKLLRLQSGVAGMYDAEGVSAAGGEDARIREVLKTVSSSGGDLAVAVAEFCREIESSLDGWQIDDAGKAKIRMQINHVRALAGEFSALNDWERGSRDMENVRVLAVDKNLGAVILPVGTASGVFNGLVCSVPAVPGVKLKIVAVRRFVSAAVVTAGDPGSIVAGMKVVAKANAKTEEN